MTILKVCNQTSCSIKRRYFIVIYRPVDHLLGSQVLYSYALMHCSTALSFVVIILLKCIAIC